MIYLLTLAGLLVAFANGANDNAKGVVTLIGSRMASARSALRWANLTTFIGALSAIPMALLVNAALLKAFGGSGLLPPSFSIDAQYLTAVGLSAALTVLLATRIGLPISTTHSLVGALVGAGLVAVGPTNIVWSALGTKFVLPLLLSPVLAAAVTFVLYPLIHRLMLVANIQEELCICIENAYVTVVDDNGTMILASSGRMLTFDEAQRCETRFAGTALTLPIHRVLAVGQFVTGGLVSFARGLNDTPKIAGILVAAGTMGFANGETHRIFSEAPVMTAVAITMLLGGVLFAHRVAKTMSEEITTMNGEQGLLASLDTATLVLLASFSGLPVSTTHVSVGALFGIGFANGTARLNTIATIVMAWVTTFPLAALIGVGIYAILRTHR